MESPTEFVVTAGPGPDEGPGVFATYRDESSAKAAFVRQRLGSTAPDAWGRLITVDASGRARVLCWFGPMRTPTTPPAPAREGPVSASQRGRATALLIAAAGSFGAAWRAANDRAASA